MQHPNPQFKLDFINVKNSYSSKNIGQRMKGKDSDLGQPFENHAFNNRLMLGYYNELSRFNKKKITH